jgi:hypothetical protein
MKNNISYYPRRADSYRHPKLKMVKVEYGREGRDKFWDLCDMIAESEHCFLDVSEAFNRADIADNLNMSIEDLEEFLRFLEHDCKLIYSEGGTITTETAQKALAIVMKDRQGARERYDNRKRTTSDDKIKTSSENMDFNNVSGTGKDTKQTHIKGKANKIKENAFTENAEAVRIDLEDSENELLIYPTFKDFWDEYDKKVGDQEKIKKKWEKLSQAEKLKIMDYIPNYKFSEPDKKFRKNPDTFFNNKSWNDEIIIKGNGREKTGNSQNSRDLKSTFSKLDKMFSDQEQPGV